MKKLIVCMLACAFLASFSVQAQITEGKHSSTVLKTGNRPDYGTWGIFIGPSLSDILLMIDQDINYRGVPLVNFKYYWDDSWEFRLGFQFYKTKEKAKGEDDESSNVKYSNVKANNRITPGFAYHFNSKNLLDVYVGAALPIGWDITKGISSSSIGNEEYSLTTTQRSFIMGAQAFIGLQVFVADLPFSIGLEYGVSALFRGGLQTKNEIKSGSSTEKYYTAPDDNDLNLRGNFDDLTMRKTEIGGDIRLTFTYYFK